MWWWQHRKNLAAHFPAKPSLSSPRDNRLWISEPATATLPGVQLFLNNHFYAFDFVGLTLDLQNRLILYNGVCQPRDIPSFRSASPENVLLSGIRAKAIKQCSFPEAQMLMDLKYPWELANEQRLRLQQHLCLYIQVLAPHSTVPIGANLSKFCLAALSIFVFTLLGVFLPLAQ